MSSATTRQTAISRLETPSRCHFHARTRNLSVCSGMNALEARQTSADMARLESSFLSAPFFLSSLNMPRETCPATRRLVVAGSMPLRVNLARST